METVRLMQALQNMFPSLTYFSDLDWPSVTAEYQLTAIDRSFPEYLQEKAIAGDCPDYLCDLAYYELALFEIQNADIKFPHTRGIFLNPSAMFLELAYDVPYMLEEAREGRKEVLERPIILCLYRDVSDELNSMELDEPTLLLLQELENGPKMDRTFLKEEDASNFTELIHAGLILDHT